MGAGDVLGGGELDCETLWRPVREEVDWYDCLAHNIRQFHLAIGPQSLQGSCDQDSEYDWSI